MHSTGRGGITIDRLKPEDVARELGVLNHTVYNLLDRDLIKGERLAHTWQISTEELAEFRNDPVKMQSLAAIQSETLKRLRRESLSGTLVCLLTAGVLVGVGIFYYVSSDNGVSGLIVAVLVSFFIAARGIKNYLQVN